MGFLDKIIHRQIKSLTKQICQAMLLAFSMAEASVKNGENNIQSYGDLAAIALLTRFRWKKTNDSIFEYENGKKIEVTADSSLADVTLSVILIELQDSILTASNPEEVFGIVTDEFVSRFTTTSDEEVWALVRKNKTWKETMGAVHIARRR
mgnify:CR=1 FL=1